MDTPSNLYEGQLVLLDTPFSPGGLVHVLFVSLLHSLGIRSEVDE